jgi:aquaporin Z
VNFKLLRPATAEFVGTALFVLVGAGSIVANAAHPNAVGGLGIAAAHGIALAVIVSAMLNVSGGHLNPAVTLGLYAARRVDGLTAGTYLVAQVAGAVLGAALVKGLFPEAAVNATNAGTPALAPHVTLLQGIWLEAAFTFLLVTVVFGTAVSTEAPRVGGFAIGLTVFAAALAVGPLTGGALNPARAIGPALVSWEFHGQAVYWIGPILGGVVAAMLWKFVLLPKEAATSTIP